MASTITATPILNDQVTAIRNTWGVGGGGGRTIIASEVIGTYPAAVSPQTSGTRGEGAADGFDPAYERMTNKVAYQVHFAVSAGLPDGGLKPYDTLLWHDEVQVGHVLTVLGYWPLGNGSGLFYCKAEERT